MLNGFSTKETVLDQFQTVIDQIKTVIDQIKTVIDQIKTGQVPLVPFLKQRNEIPNSYRSLSGGCQRLTNGVFETCFVPLRSVLRSVPARPDTVPFNRSPKTVQG